MCVLWVCDSCSAWLSVCVYLSVYLSSLSDTSPKQCFNLAMDADTASSLCGSLRWLDPIPWMQVLPSLLTMPIIVKALSLHHSLFVCVSSAFWFQWPCPCRLCCFVWAHITAQVSLFRLGLPMEFPFYLYFFILLAIFSKWIFSSFFRLVQYLVCCYVFSVWQLNLFCD